MMNIDVGGQKNRQDFKGKWKILDISDSADYKLDISYEPLPFKKNSVDNIYNSHTLEHIDASKIGFVLKEFRRVLKPDGICRIVVPDVTHAIRLYLENPKELRNKKYPGRPSGVPNTAMGCLTGWFHTNKRNLGTGHKIGFDEELIRTYCTEAGFRTITLMKYNVCSEIFKGKDVKRWAGWSVYLELKK